jgi:hypothetical protein
MSIKEHDVTGLALSPDVNSASRVTLGEKALFPVVSFPATEFFSICYFEVSYEQTC